MPVSRARSSATSSSCSASRWRPSVRKPQARFERVTISSYFAPLACSTPRRLRIADTARSRVAQQDLEPLDVARDVPCGELVVGALGDRARALEERSASRASASIGAVSRGSSDDR